MGFEIGDLVWAKMKGYPPWPAQIVERDHCHSAVKEPKNKKPHQFVYFFGSKDHAWMPEENIVPHSDSVFDTLSKKKTKGYQKAVDDFLDYLRTKKVEKHTSPKIKEKVESGKETIRVVKIVQSASKKNKRNVSSKVQVKKVSRKRKSNDKETSPKKLPAPDSSSSSSSPTYEGKVGSYEDSIPGPSRQPDFDYERDDDNADYAETFGFIGFDELSIAVLLKLIENGIKITLLKEDIEQCSEFLVDVKVTDSAAEFIIDSKPIKVKVVNSADQLVTDCDVVLCCYFPESDAFQNIIFGENGIIDGFESAKKLKLKPKGYVGLYSIDEEMSNKINEAIALKNGYYLEAPIVGSKEEAMNGELILLASGNRQLFSLCEKCFKVIAEQVVFVACEIGYSSKMSVLLNVVYGTLYATLFEAMTLSHCHELRKDDMEQVFKRMLDLGVIDDKIQKMSDQDYGTVVTPLKHVQKDINLGLSLANNKSQPMPVTSAANEVYKKARLLKYSDFDASLIYKVLGAPPKKDISNP